MRKIIPYTAFFLLPFITLTALAQFELPKYELPNDHIITYEIDDSDENKEVDQSKKTALTILSVIAILLLIVVAFLLITTIVVVRSI
jgi:hypothetical protein